MLSDMYLVISAASLLLMIGALVDIITRQDGQVKHMPKIVWVLLVVFLPLIGSVLWFVLGREYDQSSTGPLGARRPQLRPQSSTGHDVGYSTVRPRSTEEQLADLEREIEFHEKQARLERLKREVEERRDGK
jgi:hypothetical protein